MGEICVRRWLCSNALIWLILFTGCRLENDTTALRPCPQQTELSANSTDHAKMPHALKRALTVESLNMQRYIIPIPSAKDLCDYIEKKVTVIFQRIFGANIIADKIKRKPGDKSSAANTLGEIEIFYFLAMQYLARDAIAVRQTYCKNKNLVFNYKKFECWSLKTTGRPNLMTPKDTGIIKLNVFAVFGNVASFITQLLFLIVNWRARTLQPSYPKKCLLFLAATQGLLHGLQLAGILLYDVIQACTLISISSHWIALCAFVWLNCAAYEINWALVERRSFNKDERFTLYSSCAFGLTVVIALSCTIIHFSSESVFAYGQDRGCFMKGIWSSFFSFLLPIVILCFFTIIWTTWTHTRRRVTSVRNRFHNSEAAILNNKLNTAKRLTVLSITVVLIRLLHVFLRSTQMATTVTETLVSLQGVVIFIGMVTSKEALKAIKSSFYTTQNERLTYAYKYRLEASRSQANT